MGAHLTMMLATGEIVMERNFTFNHNHPKHAHLSYNMYMYLVKLVWNSLTSSDIGNLTNTLNHVNTAPELTEELMSVHH